MADLTRLDDKCLVREIDEKKRTARFHAQTTRLASDRLVILPKAGKKRNKEFMQNPIVVPYHMRFNDQGDPVVIGRVIDTEFTDDGMFQTAEFAETDRAEQWWQLIRDDFVRMVSIAWHWEDVRETEADKMLKLLDKNKIELTDAEKVLLRGVVKEFRQTDLSMVAIGADPGALKRVAEGGNEVADDLIENQRYDMANYTYDEEKSLYIFSRDADENKVGTPPPATEPKRIVVKLDVDRVGHAEDVMQTIVDQLNDQVGKEFEIVCERRPADAFSEIPGNGTTNEAIRDAVNTAIENKLKEHGVITDDKPEDDLDAPDPVDDTEARGDETEDDIYGELLNFDPDLARKETDPDVPDDLLDLAKSIQNSKE